MKTNSYESTKNIRTTEKDCHSALVSKSTNSKKMSRYIRIQHDNTSAYLHICTFLFLICISAHLPIRTSAQNYPSLTTNIPWTGAKAGSTATTVTDVQSAFNNARIAENKALGTNLPAVTFPTNTEWVGKTSNEKALWLLNKERTDRGLMPLQGIDARVVRSAQDYAQYLADHDTLGHYADGLDAAKRLTNAITSMGATQICSQFGYENLGYFWCNTLNYSSDIINRMVYTFIYEDAASNWEHRVFCLTKSITDNNGQQGNEGILGVGMVLSPHYRNPSFAYGAVGVFDFFDPCADYTPYTAVIETAGNNNKAGIYPNPSDKILYLQNDENIERVVIINLTGEKIMDKVPLHGQIDISALAAGIYFVRLQDKNQHLSIEKLIVLQK